MFPVRLDLVPFRAVVGSRRQPCSGLGQRAEVSSKCNLYIQYRSSSEQRAEPTASVLPPSQSPACLQVSGVGRSQEVGGLGSLRSGQGAAAGDGRGRGPRVCRAPPHLGGDRHHPGQQPSRLRMADAKRQACRSGTSFSLAGETPPPHQLCHTEQGLHMQSSPRKAHLIFSPS